MHPLNRQGTNRAVPTERDVEKERRVSMYEEALGFRLGPCTGRYLTQLKRRWDSVLDDVESSTKPRALPRWR
jgi:hypothetical protein